MKKSYIALATLFIFGTSIYADGDIQNVNVQSVNNQEMVVDSKPQYKHKAHSRGTKIVKKKRKKRVKHSNSSRNESVNSNPLIGKGSWYGITFNGCRTASGERFKENKYTAAHRTLPFGTIVNVTDRDTGRSIVVKINDRGPFAKSRIIDLSCQAGRDLGIAGKGVFKAKLEILDREEGKKKLELQ